MHSQQKEKYARADYSAQLNKSFRILVRKIWCRQFSSLHPKAFKMSLGLVHPPFAGSRQVRDVFCGSSHEYLPNCLIRYSKIVKSSLMCCSSISMNTSLSTAPLQLLKVSYRVHSRVS